MGTARRFSIYDVGGILLHHQKHSGRPSTLTGILVVSESRSSTLSVFGSPVPLFTWRRPVTIGHESRSSTEPDELRHYQSRGFCLVF
jgi:hypothetical protein